MQEEHAKAEAEERESERQAERNLIHGETAPLVREVQELKGEIAALRKEVSAAMNGATARRAKRSTSAPN